MHSVAELDRHALALAEEQGTPFFLFSEGALAERIDQIRGAFDQVEIAYSVKTNYELGLLRRIQQFGCGASVGSEIELALARQAGFSPEMVCLDGPAKSERLICEALEWGVRAFNADSEEELDRLAASKARVLLRVRIPPGWRGGVAEAAAGRFGVPYARAVALRDRVQGFAIHLGSQLVSSVHHVRWLEKLSALRPKPVELILGGGFPSPFLRRGLLGRRAPGLRAFCEPIARAAAGLGAHLVLEPGRAIVGPAGWLYAGVVARKSRWAFLDAGKNMLPESLVFARRQIELVDAGQRACRRIHLAGPTLSSADVLGFGLTLPDLQVGDLLRFGAAGAYTLSRVSRFGTYVPPAWIVTRDGDLEPLRRPDSLDDVMRPMV